jgi:hypothetical protein
MRFSSRRLVALTRRVVTLVCSMALVLTAPVYSQHKNPIKQQASGGKVEQKAKPKPKSSDLDLDKGVVKPAKWILVTKSTTESVYYDPSHTEYRGDAIFMWTKWVPLNLEDARDERLALITNPDAKDIVACSQYGYNIQLLAFRCEPRQTSLVMYADYTTSGKLLEKATALDFGTEWHSVIPSSLNDRLIRLVCR